MSYINIEDKLLFQNVRGIEYFWVLYLLKVNLKISMKEEICEFLREMEIQNLKKLCFKKIKLKNYIEV